MAADFDDGTRHSEADPVLVRKMAPEDVRVAANLHDMHLPHGFFPQLGTRFLREYYRSFMSSPYSIALAVGEPGLPRGVLIGVMRPREHYRWVVRTRTWRLAMVGSAALLARPRVLGLFLRDRLPRYVRAIRSLRSRSGGTETNGAPMPPRPAVLAHIVADPRVRGRGVAAALVDRFLEEARSEGIQSARATTLEGPEGATGFYERCGWQRQLATKDWDEQPIVVFERPTGFLDPR